MAVKMRKGKMKDWFELHKSIEKSIEYYKKNILYQAHNKELIINNIVRDMQNLIKKMERLRQKMYHYIKGSNRIIDKDKFTSKEIGILFYYFDNSTDYNIKKEEIENSIKKKIGLEGVENID